MISCFLEFNNKAQDSYVTIKFKSRVEKKNNKKVPVGSFNTNRSISTLVHLDLEHSFLHQA